MIPEVFSSEECWSSRVPGEEEMFVAVMDPSVYGKFSVLRSYWYVLWENF